MLSGNLKRPGPGPVQCQCSQQPGGLLQRSGGIQIRLAEFEAALALEPSEFMAVYNIGLTHQLMENPEPALEFFLKAGDLKPDVYEINLNTGQLLLQTDRLKKPWPFWKNP